MTLHAALLALKQVTDYFLLRFFGKTFYISHEIKIHKIKVRFMYLWTELAFYPVEVVVKITSLHQITAPGSQLGDDPRRLT